MTLRRLIDLLKWLLTRVQIDQNVVQSCYNVEQFELEELKVKQKYELLKVTVES